MDDVTLKVNGSVFSGWKTVSIKQSLKAISGSFDLGVTDKWTEKQQPWLIVPGNTCGVFIGKDQVISGYVDRSSPSFDATSRGTTIRGRDKTGDLVDCSAIHVPGNWTNIRLDALAKIVCGKFGISVTVTSDASSKMSKPFYLAKIQPGESAFDFLERNARLRGVLLTGDGKGGVLITLAGSVHASNDLVQGQNIKAASADFDMQERFSQYIVKAQDAVLEGTDPSTAFTIQGQASDSKVSRYRPKLVQAEGAIDPATCTKRAQWEVKVRAAKAAKYSVKVQGWRQKNGSLWQLNQLVRLKSEWLGVNMDMLVTDLNFTRGDNGTETDIGLERPDAYTVDPTLIDRNEILAQLVQADRNRK